MICFVFLILQEHILKNVYAKKKKKFCPSHLCWVPWLAQHRQHWQNQSLPLTSFSSSGWEGKFLVDVNLLIVSYLKILKRHCKVTGTIIKVCCSYLQSFIYVSADLCYCKLDSLQGQFFPLKIKEKIRYIRIVRKTYYRCIILKL